MFNSFAFLSKRNGDAEKTANVLCLKINFFFCVCKNTHFFSQKAEKVLDILANKPRAIQP